MLKVAVRGVVHDPQTYRGRDRDHVDAEELLDFVHLSPALLVADKRYADSHPSESACSTYPVQVGLAIWATVL